MNTILIDNIKTVKNIPTGHYLVIYEKGSNPDSGMVLYGFHELETFADDYKEPAYCFIGNPQPLSKRAYDDRPMAGR